MKKLIRTRQSVLDAIKLTGMFCVRTHIQHHKSCSILLQTMEEEGLVNLKFKEGNLHYYELSKTKPKILLSFHDTIKNGILTPQQVNSKLKRVAYKRVERPKRTNKELNSESLAEAWNRAWEPTYE